MLIWRYLDANGGGGEGGENLSGTGGTEGGGNVGGSGGGTNEGGKGGAAGTGGNPADGKAVDYEAFYNQHKETVTRLPELEKENSTLKKSVDTLGNKLGNYKQIETGMKTDPKSFIEKIAAEHQIKVNFGDAPAAFQKDPSEMTKEEHDRYIESKVNEGVEKHKLSMSKEFAMIRENEMKNKYDDWGDQSDARDNLRLSLINGNISHSEVHHLALRGANIPKILEAHKATVIAEYQADLEQKAAASQHGGGYRSSAPAPKGANESQLDLTKKQGQEALQKAFQIIRH